MLETRERLLAGLQTETTFCSKGRPQVIANVLSRTGVIYKAKNLRLHPSRHYKAGCVLDVNIGDDNQAFAILHGELTHEDPTIIPHLLITWLYWEQESDPVYQTSYQLEIDEVMPSDEVDIIPFNAVCEVLCSLEELPRRLDQCHGRHTVFWKQSHVYISGEEQVMAISDASALPAEERHPDPVATAAARRARTDITNAKLPPLRDIFALDSPSTKSRPLFETTSYKLST